MISGRIGLISSVAVQWWAMGFKRISVVCPYMLPLTKMVVDYIESEGIEVKDYHPKKPARAVHGQTAGEQPSIFKLELRAFVDRYLPAVANFNRRFLEGKGMKPTEFRRQAAHRFGRGAGG